MSEEAEVKAGEAASASIPDPETKETEKTVEAKTEQDTEGKAKASPEGADDEDVDPADAETEEEGDDTPKPKKQPRSQRYQRKIAALETEVAELRRREAERSTAKEPPKESDFNGDFEAYNRAMIAHEVAETLRKEQAAATKDDLKARQDELTQERVDVHLDRVTEARKVLPDYDAVLEKGLNVHMPDKTLELIMDSEKSAHIAYYLAKHPESVKSLAKMGPLDAARYLGGLEARLSLPKPKTQTSAPAPVTPLKGGSTPSNPDKDLDAWLKKTYG